MAGKTQSKEVKFYNLDVIISVGYRVKSIQGTRFRQWATERLNEYIVKGFTMNDSKILVVATIGKSCSTVCQPKTFSALHGCILRIKLNLCKSVKSVGHLMGVQDMTSDTPTSL